jgi:hypothetical protein
MLLSITIGVASGAELGTARRLAGGGPGGKADVIPPGRTSDCAIQRSCA